MTKPLMYFFDKKMEKRVPVNELGQVDLDWGETIPGENKEKILYVKNVTDDRLILRQPYTLDEDLLITDYPPNLLRKESGRVKLEFKPNRERIESMKHAEWGFEVVVG